MKKPKKRFRIAFSFAGEKREFVAQVAANLARHFSEAAILYDKYHEAEFSRHRLGFDLPDLYHNNSDLIVPVFCPDYENKEWCKRRLKSAAGGARKVLHLPGKADWI